MSTLSGLTLPDFCFVHNVDYTGESDLFTLHCHDCFEVYLFIRGSGYYVVEGNRYELRPLSMLVMRPGEVHCFRKTGPENYERCVINFSPSALGTGPDLPPSLLAPFLKREAGRKNLYRVADDSLTHRIFTELDEIARLRPPTEAFEAVRLLGVLLAGLSRAQAAPDFESGESESSCLLINEVIQYINSNLTHPLRLDEIAAHFYVSKYHLSRMFKKLMGVPVIDYVIRKRIFLAERMLRAGATTGEACAEAGFGDYTSFYRSFRRVTGYSPNQMKSRDPAYMPGRVRT